MVNAMKTRMMMWMIGAACCVMAGGVTGQETYRLASAQAVGIDGGPPLLRLSANGPIAFSVEPPPPDGSGGGPAQVVVRLHGVAMADGADFSSVAPFAVSASSDQRGTRLVIQYAGVPPDRHLAVRAGLRSSEIEIVSAPND